jgi:sugar-specific transcriptional regulator TrmB
MEAESRHVLVEFGFTALESEIYAFLLSESPATGYRIAQAIQKPAANTYKAIQTLEAKGAVMVEEGENRLCRAVPAAQLLAMLEAAFARRHQEATRALHRLGSPSPDERIYAVRSVELLERLTFDLMAGAEREILLSASEDVLLEAEEALAAARGRGVVVDVRSLPRPEMRLTVDARTCLLANAENDPVALHSAHPALVAAVREGLLAEVRLGQVERTVREGGGAKRVARVLGLRRTAGDDDE